MTFKKNVYKNYTMALKYKFLYFFFYITLNHGEEKPHLASQCKNWYCLGK